MTFVLQPLGHNGRIPHEVAKKIRAALAVRDGTGCRLCGKAIDMTIEGNDPWGPSLDHILARADGGKNVPENWQLAHQKCNSKKGSELSKRRTIIARAWRAAASEEAQRNSMAEGAARHKMRQEVHMRKLALHLASIDPPEAWSANHARTRNKPV